MRINPTEHYDLTSSSADGNFQKRRRDAVASRPFLQGDDSAFAKTTLDIDGRGGKDSSKGLGAVCQSSVFFKEKIEGLFVA